MCGIFGIVAKAARFSHQELTRICDDLFRLSESRGKESSGLAALTAETIAVYKQPAAASVLVKSDEYHALLRRFDGDGVDGSGRTPIALMGHARLVTNGSQENHDNNQPVIKDGIVGIHNGIIVNDTALWQEFPTLQRRSQVDTEVLLSLIRHFYLQSGQLTDAIREAFQRIEGTASIAAMFTDLNVMALATNNGSLYTCRSFGGDATIFASEQYILQQLAHYPYLRKQLDRSSIRQIEPGSGCILSLTEAATEPFSLTKTDALQHPVPSGHCTRTIEDVTPKSKIAPAQTAPAVISPAFEKRFSIDPHPIMALRRCTRCILPETMPFIEFDDEGVCNYCRNYRKIEVLGEEALRDLTDRYRRKDGKPDCLVTFSGGRDSSFCVHYIKTVLGMTPLTYTYDWGMVTDLGRRNQARICGKLGLEHILISADINKKRANIRKNVNAWLKHPDLGTVPLFMAGDKQYFYYANQLMKQAGVNIAILGENFMETTMFKSGFCDIPPAFGAEHTYTLSALNKVRLALYYGKQYLANPAYINTSLLDTLGAFASYYLIPHHVLNLYNYIMWDEDKIVSTLIREYNWETATDTRTTWRIGDGTAAFYNYIYYCVAGFSENDTFRSNQIREGLITREQGLETIYDENQPRFASIQWYCNIIGIDPESALERINAIPKRYKTRA